MGLPPIHPAVYSKELIAPLIEELAAANTDQWVDQWGVLLDPFAGLGIGLAKIAHALGLRPVGIEIEPGYLSAAETDMCVQLGDSRALPFVSDSIDAGVTSPAYPNGISDNFHANDPSRRHTYVHRLRAHLGNDYELQWGNTGGMNPRRSAGALKDFYGVHEQVWAEMFRVLKPGAPFVVNTKDPMNIPFKTDTQAQLVAAGFEIVRERQVSTGGLNHGRNRENKYHFEDITVARKPR